MSTKRGGLGRNLSALLGASPTSILSLTPTGKSATTVSVEHLQPGKYQPRTLMNDHSLQELSNSIKQQGLLQPLLARPIGDNRFEILAGERRWRACKLAGLTNVPIIIHDVDNETAMAIALVENLQREDLNPVDHARAIARLSDEFSLTHQEISQLLSKSRSAISNYLRLLALPGEILSLLEHGDIDVGHARALLTLESTQMIRVAHLVVAKDLSVRETEKVVHRLKLDKPLELEETAATKLANYESYLSHLTRFLGTKINIKPKKSGKGTVVIHYNSPNELEVMMSKIGNFSHSE